jgi:hypothetical protein
MKKYLIVRSVFNPKQTNKTIFNINFKNILNLINFIKFQNLINKPDLLLIGYSHDKEQTTLLTRIIQDKSYNNYFDKITVDFFNINKGKYVIMNKIHNYLQTNIYSGLLYSDHDIIFDHFIPDTSMLDNELLNKLDLTANSIINDKQIGYVALNHIGDIRHQPDIHTNNIILDEISNIKITYPDNNTFGSIASGCFYCLYDSFMKITPLTVISIYGLDDYNIIKKLVEYNYHPVVYLNYSVLHPKILDNNNYQEWKQKTVLKLLNDPDYNYNTSLIDSINFWSYDNN